jgi:hypothetical protein
MNLLKEFYEKNSKGVQCRYTDEQLKEKLMKCIELHKNNSLSLEVKINTMTLSDRELNGDEFILWNLVYNELFNFLNDTRIF